MSSPLAKSETETHTCTTDVSNSGVHVASPALTSDTSRTIEITSHVIDIIVTDEDDLVKNNIPATYNNIELNNSTTDAEGTVTYFGSANLQRRRDESGLFSRFSHEKSDNQEFVVRYNTKLLDDADPAVVISTNTSSDKCKISVDEYNQMPCIDRSNSCTRLLTADDPSPSSKLSPQSSVFLADSIDSSSYRSCIYQDVSSQTDDFSAIEASPSNKGISTLTTNCSTVSFVTIDTTQNTMTSSNNVNTVVLREDDIDLALIFLPHMVASCIAMWCCGCLFGCIGFALAVFGSRISNEGDHVRAKRLSRASLACAVLGVITGLLAVILLLFAVLGVFGDNNIIRTTPSPLPTQPPLRPPFF